MYTAFIQGVVKYYERKNTLSSFVLENTIPVSESRKETVTCSSLSELASEICEICAIDEIGFFMIVLNSSKN